MQFTPREQAIIAELWQGKGDREIAGALQCHQSTVKAHLRRVASKMGIPADKYCTRVRIVYLLARQRGLIA